jgi:5,10-methylene-tetrahydrofolate dehydrogenase/methenyl tetrahydrofolate cyclohydrolase
VAELGWNPWLVLVTTPVHSATNLGAVRLMKRRSVTLMEAIMVVVGAGVFVLGLLAWHR